MSNDKKPRWCARCLGILLRFGRKQPGPWDDHDSDECDQSNMDNLPGEAAAASIVELPDLLAIAEAAQELLDAMPEQRAWYRDAAGVAFQNLRRALAARKR